MRGERTGCMWDPHWGNRRLLYDCVWLVSVNQWVLQILLWVCPAPLRVSLHCRLWLSNCASLGGALCEPRPSWLQVTKAQVRRRPSTQVSRTAFAINSYFGKPNYLRRLVRRVRIVIWLILPVVICLSQRLSHACLSINDVQWNCEWLIKTVIVYLVIDNYMDNRGNSRANTCCGARLHGRAVFIR